MIGIVVEVPDRCREAGCRFGQVITSIPIPPELAEWDLKLAAEGSELRYEYDGTAERSGIPSLLRRMSDLGIPFKDLNTHQSSLEDIFVSLVSERRAA